MLFTLLLLQAAPSLALTCGGGGSAIREDVATVYGAQNRGNSAWPTMHDKRRAPYQDRVHVRIDSGESRIRLPEALLPAGQDGDGWFALEKLRTTDESITGFAAVHLLSRQKVHIDRAAGTIRISGRSGSYSGICESAAS